MIFSIIELSQIGILPGLKWHNYSKIFHGLFGIAETKEGAIPEEGIEGIIDLANLRDESNAKQKKRMFFRFQAMMSYWKSIKLFRINLAWNILNHVLSEKFKE